MTPLNNQAWEDLFPDGLSTSAVHTTNANDADMSTAETVAIMGLNAMRASRTPQVAKAVKEVMSNISSPTPTRKEICEHVWKYVHNKIRFCEDESLVKQLWGAATSLLSGGVELLISPDRLLTMAQPQGDCDDFSQLIATMLVALNIPVQFVTVAADRSAPMVWSHVYVQARLEDGSPYVMDASHGKYPGWEVEASRVTRKQVWPFVHGLQDGVMGLLERGLGMFRGFRGLGDDSTTVDLSSSLWGSPDPTSSTTLAAPGSATTSTFGWGNILNIDPSSSSGVSTSSNATNVPAAAIASITGSVSNALKSIFAPTSNPTLLPGQYYVTSANGVTSVQGTPTSGGTNNLTSSTSMLPLLLIGGAVLLFASMSKR